MSLRPLLLLCLILSGAYLQAQQDTLVYFEVRFDLDSDRLKASEKESLDSLLQQYPISILKGVKLYGHTDSLADIEYNRKLSKRRVLAVLQYLVYQKLDPRLASTDFYGEEKPRYSNAPEERFKNRRVELEFLVDLTLLPDPERKISEQNLETGTKIRLANLNFVGNQAIPMWHSMDELRELLLVMERNPELELKLHGHVCCSNDFELSVARARMVYDFLLSQGISKNRLEYQGHGNKQPLFDEVDEKSRALNRRVEAEILFNDTDRKEAEAKKRLRVEAPVMNVQFVKGNARLTPSGDFMLSLIADMLKESEGLFFEFEVYDNINNSRLSAQRAAAIERTFRKKGVKNNLFKVNTLAYRPGLEQSADINLIRVKLIET
ncbi:OmpA family protein [Croceimicrobium sp.]|uniref:OmpA family protein n=1 Tax=Croceimicrobium sp. TaxID=2828340 RepID=UPI003BA940FC